MQPTEHPRPIGPWLPRLRQGPVRIISSGELRDWIVHEDEQLLVVNKPGDFVCHPSKDGPWSSLVGAVREYLALSAAHLVFRLDRETSGLVVFAKEPRSARRLQMAAQEHRYHKTYVAVLQGALRASVTVDQPLGPDLGSPVAAKSTVVARGEGQPAVTHFVPKVTTESFSLVEVVTDTGRKHQIRAHALWLGHPLVGDKIYGPDPRLFLEFVDNGWSDALAARLLLPRQALHCARIDLHEAGFPLVVTAPLPADLADFCRLRAGIDPASWV